MTTFSNDDASTVSRSHSHSPARTDIDDDNKARDAKTAPAAARVHDGENNNATSAVAADDELTPEQVRCVRVLREIGTSRVRRSSAIWRGDARSCTTLLLRSICVIDRYANVDMCVICVVARVTNAQVADLNVSETMRNVFAAARKYGMCVRAWMYAMHDVCARAGVQIEPRFSTLVIATAVMEGVGRQLVSVLRVRACVYVRACAH
jgi:hypothetical protein